MNMGSWSQLEDPNPQPSPSPPHTELLPRCMHPDLFYDPRTIAGPSKFVRAVIGSPGIASAIAHSEDRLRCAIAGKESLKIIRIFDPSLPTSQSDPAQNAPSLQSSHSHSRRGAKSLGRGPGKVQIYEDMSLWSTSRLGLNNACSDVDWGQGQYNNKILTACTNGNVVLWDIQATGTKVEKVWNEHTRAVNVVRFSPLVHSSFLTGSADATVKLWDLRSPHAATHTLPHRAAPRTLAISPIPSANLRALIALDSGDLILWDLRQGTLGVLDRVPVAHRGAILGMDWIGPGEEDGRAWLCTGGLDRTVKVWDMSHSTIPQIPTHTLHTPNGVKRVLWRPEHDTEIAVVPLTSGISPAGGPGAVDDPNAVGGEADKIEVWDVRREWISKYILEAGDGAVADIAWAHSGTLWASYKNGGFVQHDLRACSRPIDATPKSSMTWDATGGIVFASQASIKGEVPFDDIQPSLRYLVAQQGVKEKNPADPPFAPSNQVVARVPLPVMEAEAFIELARNYVLGGETQESMCSLNAAAASKAGQDRAARTWHLLQSLLTPLVPVIVDLPPPIPPRAPSVMSSIRSPMLSPYQATSYSRTHARKISSISALTGLSAGTPNSSPNSLHTSPSDPRRWPSKSVSRPPHSRRTSNATKTSSGKRSSRGSRSRSASIDRRAKQVGDGALDSDSDSDDEDIRLHAGDRMSLTQTLLAASKVPPSPLARTVLTAGGTPSTEASQDVGDLSTAAKYSPGKGKVSFSSRGQTRRVLIPQDQSSEEDGALADDNYYSTTSNEQDSPAVRPAELPQDDELPLTAAIFPGRPKITKQESHSSMRTAVPSRSKIQSDGVTGASTGTGTESSGAARPRKSSPAPELLSPSEIVEGNEEAPKELPSESNLKDESSDKPARGRPRLPKRRIDNVAAESAFRDIGWEALGEALEFYSEQGDLQMSASLITAAGSHLTSDPVRVERIMSSYVDVLSRMRLHSSASYVRKHAPSVELQNLTKFDTTFYTSCGRCRRVFVAPPVHPEEEPPRGGFQYCTNCRMNMARCSICRLPCRGLFFFCQVCNHGGHESCYRKYYLSRPMIEGGPNMTESMRSSWSRSTSVTRTSTFSMASSTSESSSTDTAMQEDGLGRREKERREASFGGSLRVGGSNAAKKPVSYHTCAAGCGHHCWAANISEKA